MIVSDIVVYILLLFFIMGAALMGACAILFPIIIMAEYAGNYVNWKFMVTNTRMLSYETGIGIKLGKLDV